MIQLQETIQSLMRGTWEPQDETEIAIERVSENFDDLIELLTAMYSSADEILAVLGRERVSPYVVDMMQQFRAIKKRVEDELEVMADEENDALTDDEVGP